MTARQGWIADPLPPPPRDYIPGEEHKWSLMMNAGQFTDKYKVKHTERAEEQKKTPKSRGRDG